MADETTQTGEETSWWDLDIFGDSELPSTSFDEPLEWPETLDWGDFSAPEGDLEFPGPGDLESDHIFAPPADPEPPAPPAAPPERAPVADTQWRAVGDDGDPTMPHVTVLSGLGGGGRPAPVARAAEPTVHERLPESLWAGDALEAGPGVGPVVTTTMAAPSMFAEPDDGGGGWRRRFDIRHGNAAVIALIALVSLILLGMFMSVRARNQTPITSVTPTTSDQIQVQGTLNTVPLTTLVNTTPPTINIGDLVPPAEDATTATAGAGTGASANTSPATTAAPTRSTPPAGSTATTAPAAQPTNTTAAPATTAPPETTTPPVTSPPANQTTTPTVTRRTNPTFPSLTTTVPEDSTPTVPSIPGFPTIPGFPN